MSNLNADSTMVQVIAAHADLPITDDRITPINQILAAWIKDANVLSRKMSDPKYASLAPITGILQTVSHGEVSK